MKMIERRPRGRPRALDRDEALESAMLLFWRNGYEGTSITDLTTAMGVTPPSLYAAFGSKERLYLDALDRYSESHGAFARQALESEPTARLTIERILREAIEVYAGKAAPRGCMLATGALACAEEHAAISAELARRRLEAIGALRARFERAVAEGELLASADAEALANYYAAVIQGIAIQARDGVSAEALHKLARTALTAWPARP